MTKPVFIFLLRFVKHPEYLKEGQRLVFREGRTKAVGNVNKVASKSNYVKSFNKNTVCNTDVKAAGTRVLSDKLRELRELISVVLILQW